MASLVQQASPLLLARLPRLVGLGAGEQAAVVSGGIPKTALFGLAVIGGALLGLYVGKRWPVLARKVYGP
jgi:hypothetical protein